MATKSFYQDILLKGNAALKLEDGDTNAVSLVSPAALGADYTLTLPTDDGDADELLSTDGSGVLSFLKIADSNVAASAAIALNKLAAVTADRALTSDGSGFASASTVTSTELGYVSGVTSAIQTQFTGKLSLTGGTMSGAIAMGTNKITGLGSGTVATDAVNKGQLDAAIAGLTWKDAARVASAANVASLTTITATDFDGTAQGVTLITGDRVLLKNQTTTSENGLYEYDGADLVRTTDMDGGTEADGAAVFVQEGTYADSGWTQTEDSVTIGTDAMVWSQFTASGAFTGGNGIDISGNTISVDLDTDSGMEFDTAKLQVKLNGTTLARTTDGLSVNEINNAQIGASAAIALTKLAAVTANRALTSDGSGFVVVSAVTDTELGYVSGVTSAIQTQLDTKSEVAATDWVTGDGTSKAITHNFGTLDVMVTVYDKTDNSTIDVPAVRTNTNTVTLTSTEAPGASGWRVVVIG